jgi:hypothetical protein
MEMEKHEEEQELILRNDREQHQAKTLLTINGIKCSIKWNECMRHYCGYVLIETDLSLTEIVPPHGGWTAFNGFDCAHLGDFPAFLHGTFKTFEFVEQELFRLTEWIVQNNINIEDV